ncbi:universal stress protein [Candidatus Entotheonella palauensis]|uniref:universal stress protein n=1 Tax=Candidatus Entotheonella palauensis TaxID=93172 RepID=UPI000B7E8A2E|nr:universal stress protein [Candidatus Entotheonella palauensis]
MAPKKMISAINCGWSNAPSLYVANLILMVNHHSGQGGLMYSKVLVPLDGSEVSERALAHAQRVAEAFGARVYLLQIISLTHEYEAVRGGGDESLITIEYSQETARQITASRQTRAEAYLAALAAQLEETGIQVEASVRQGPTSDHIMNFIEETGIDPVVMSTHGRSGLQRFFLGSVTDRVIRSSRVPVLAVPLED